MMINYNGLVHIATGLSVSSRMWKNEELLWSELVSKLTTEYKTSETRAEFLKATKDEQTKIKDIGGFVGGYLNGGKRKNEAVQYRQVITLDIDFAYKDFWWDFTMLYSNAAVLHATHKSCDKAPRYRLIMPIDREVTAEEYQAIARHIAGNLNIDLFDPSTFEVARLMFWPSVPKDIDFYSEVQDGPWICADEVLDTYVNWHDTSEWPTANSQLDRIKTEIKRQEDPTAKKGIVGVFCRTYTIQDVIAQYLPDIYEEAGENRYTYTKGSTAAGLIVYDDKFAYSHHGTDPASGRLCNAFDLVRIHLFGHLDSGREKIETESKSYKAMEELATKDALVKHTIADERFAEAKFDFATEVPEDDNYDDSWIEELEANAKGEYVNSANNLNLIIENDRMLKNAFKLNVFDNKRYITKSMPWRRIEGDIDLLKDVDYSGIRNYIECIYGIVASQKVDDAIALEFERHSYHPICDYLKSLTWDGKERLDTALIDYFGAEDNIYVRAALRKSMCAAVARVFCPGTKFDLVLTLISEEQGLFKSTFVNKLGKQWFSDTFTTVQGKEAFEQIQGAWVIEIAELSGLKKAEVEAIKHFISKKEDMFRPAYGRVVETYKRQCVFFGTTNNNNFLRDSTGNRRFMPIDVRPEFITKSVRDDLTDYEVDQLWAEAYKKWQEGELLYLNDEEEKIARCERDKHSETDERVGLIESYLDTLLPADWYDWDIEKRQDYFRDTLVAKGTLKRDCICVAEIWCECLGKNKTDMTRYTSREINDLMRMIPGWQYTNSTKNFSFYGKQKYYTRKAK